MLFDSQNPFPHPSSRSDQTTVFVASDLRASDAIGLIAGWHDIKPARRRELASALNTLARVIGTQPEMLILDPERIRTAAVQKSAAGWCVDRATKSNVLCRLRVILQRLDIIDPPTKLLLPEWAALHTLADDRLRMSFATFMYFCTARNIKPIEVESSTLEAFELWLIRRTINANPRGVVTAARRAWNEASNKIEGWPKINLPLANRRGQFLLPFKKFPKSLQKDVEKYTEKLAMGDLPAMFGIADYDHSNEKGMAADSEGQLHNEGQLHKMAFKPLRPLTIQTKVRHILVVANALHRTGVALTEITSLESLVKPMSHALVALKLLWEENGCKSAPKLGHAAKILFELAKCHAECSPGEIAKLGGFIGRLGVRYTEMTVKNRQLIEQVITPHRLKRLNALPDALLQEAVALGNSRRAVVAAQRATMLALLSKCPMRLGNLMGLRLDEHLMRPDPALNLISAIIIPAWQTKNDRQLTYPLSPATSAILKMWTQQFRPLIAAPGNPFLFPGTGTNPMTRAGVRDSIKAITHERLGVAINPHAFRHLAARRFLKKYPGQYESVRQILGHGSLTTTTRAYSGSEGETALAQFDNMIEDERRFVDIQNPSKMAAGKKPRPKCQKVAPATSKKEKR